ncbi:MAG TPA: multidrug efflux SMR transporter [Streptosporangiaceae bacterium]|jgi:small multidrug resistance pump
MPWLLLAGAIATEVAATASLKASEGLTRLVPSIVVGVGYVASFVLLAWALKLQLQVSVAYAIWSGVGTAAIAMIGMIWLDEPLTAVKTLGIVLIIAGTVVLNLAGSS